MAVYFIVADELRRVKIGFSDDPARRFVKVQTDSPCVLRLAAVMDADEEEERRLHRMFAGSCIGGEWFWFSPEIQRLIDSCPYVVPEREPSAQQRLRAIGVSATFASNIVNGVRVPSIPLMLDIYEKTGLRYGLIRNGSPEDIAALRRLLDSSQESVAEEEARAA